ncbi:general secretion pathway protein F [Comamonas sp. BIGb0152]|uniref:type II secretion system F family protein n=1 Tax=Comamonas sp. BIGb0152 TaxID=2940601 RepID=UPI0021673F35|nr:type II secretion system F family protein [Comamonas sp. BIGb0152]MCS4294719.1 general secretion pathway protein F [Comamonas sp. BIGb0152]
MADFAWHAINAAGEQVRGTFQAPNAAAVQKHLRAQKLTPVRIVDAVDAAALMPAAAKSGAKPAAVGALVKPKARKSQKGPAKAADVLAMTSELSIMLKAGLALDNALRVLIDMAFKDSMRELLTGVLEAVKGGVPLSKALMAHQELFGDFYINMVRSGEASGQMSAVLQRLVEHLERQRALKESVVSATIYPMILVAVAILSLIAMLGFVVPQFEKLFTDMGDALPTPTKIVMTIGQVFRKNGWVLLLGGAAVVYLLRGWLRSPKGRLWWQGVLLRMPILGRLALKYQLTLYSRSLGTLLGNGVPLLTALHIATDTVSNRLIQQELAKIPPIVKEGGKMVQAMNTTTVFEPLAVNLVRVGEETGRLGSMMLELSNILNREVETGIKRALTMIEPVLILVLGLLIASIIVSILMGILSVNDLAA